MLARVYDVSRIDSGLLSMMLQLLGETLHCIGMLQLIALPGPAQLVTAHVHFHLSTTRLPSRDLARQALYFLSPFLLSFFVSPIPPVFFLIDLVTNEQKK